jgi:hypothetical protein
LSGIKHSAHQQQQLLYSSMFNDCQVKIMAVEHEQQLLYSSMFIGK